jgi:hypothetical protein
LGHLQPTDHYWYEGLEDWGLLGEFLSEDAWRPPAEIAPPISPRNYVRLIAAACAVVAFFGIVVRLSQPTATSPAIALPPPSVATGPQIRDLSRTDPKFREKAIAALDELVGKLPRAATLPTNLFYYAMNVAVPESPGALTATITGAEDMVDPITQKTAWHTPFVLTLDYVYGQWMYRDYRASTTDLRDGTVAEIDGSRKASIQPTIVSILGIKTVPDRIEHE